MATLCSVADLLSACGVAVTGVSFKLHELANQLNSTDAAPTTIVRVLHMMEAGGVVDKADRQKLLKELSAAKFAGRLKPTDDEPMWAGHAPWIKPTKPMRVLFLHGNGVNKDLAATFQIGGLEKALGGQVDVLEGYMKLTREILEFNTGISAEMRQMAVDGMIDLYCWCVATIGLIHQLIH
jgi:hypothetical protein